MSDVRAISLGGGRQSTALAVLAKRGVIDFPLAIMANVGDRAENPATLAYLRDHLMPWAEAVGYEIVVRRWVDRTGRERDLYDDTMDIDRRSIDIPVYMAGGAPGNRKCTGRYKIEVVGRELRQRGATAEHPATVAVGIAVDEIERISSRKAQPWEIPTYPLIDLRMTTSDCIRVIREEGLPVPPKSACWFCPFQRTQQWAEKRRDDPEQFWQAVEMEDRINEKRERMERDHVYLTPTVRPLRDLTEAQADLFGGPASCDEGYCWT